MTRADVIRLVRDLLGYNEVLNEALILRTMDLVQSRYENGHDMAPLPWFNLVVDQELNTVADQRIVPLPDGFVSFAEEWKPYLVTSDGTTYPLARRDGSILTSIRDEIGRPSYYETDNVNLYMYPLPDDIYSIYVTYYATGTPLSTTTSSPWFTFFPSLIAEETAYRLARNARDSAFLQISEVRSERANYVTKVEEQKNIVKQIRVGGDGA